MCSIYQKALLVVNILYSLKHKKATKVHSLCWTKMTIYSGDHHNMVLYSLKRQKSNKSAQSLLNWKDLTFKGGAPQHGADVPLKVIEIQNVKG